MSDDSVKMSMTDNEAKCIGKLLHAVSQDKTYVSSEDYVSCAKKGWLDETTAPTLKGICELMWWLRRLAAEMNVKEMDALQKPTISVWWTDEGNLMSEEDKKKYTDSLLEMNHKHRLEFTQARFALDGLNYCAVPTEHLAEIYKNLRELLRLGQIDVRKIEEENPEVCELRRKIFSLSDFAAVYAGQYLPRDVARDIWESKSQLK